MTWPLRSGTVDLSAQRVLSRTTAPSARPVLAKGREWYEDGPIVQSFIDQTLTEYGQPDLTIRWTTPKRIVAGKHHR